jgi:hypothetical protein
MPSLDHVNFTDADLSAVVAYVKPLPPVDNVQPAVSVGPTAAGRVKDWSDAQLAHFFRTGIGPDGSPVNSVMPIRLTKAFTDDEIRALTMYLRSLPPVPTPGTSRPPHDEENTVVDSVAGRLFSDR